MSEEVTKPQETNGTTQHAVAVDQTVPHFRLTEERTKREQATRSRDDLVTQLEKMKGDFAKAKKELSGIKSSHQQEMYLVEQGFKAPSVRRFFKREYADSVADLPVDNRPEFGAWLEANQDDPLYSVHFNRLSQSDAPKVAEDGQKESAPPPVENNAQLIEQLRAALVGNPDAGASQPKDHKQKEWTADEIRKLRAKNKPQGSSRGKIPNGELAQILSEWRAKGIIK